MQHDEPPRHYSGGRGSAAGWPRTGEPEPGYAIPPGGAPVARRTRAGLVVLIAFLVELVIIAGIGNPSVTRRIGAAIGPDSGLGSNAARASLEYQWRFTAASGDTAHLWAGELALVGTVFVLTALLVWAAARGPAGFVRTFFGTWTAVIVATLLGAVARGSVIDPRGYVPYPGGRLNAALFGPPAPNGTSLVAGVGLGLVVALAAGLTALLARRTVGTIVPLPAEAEPYPSGPEHTQQFPRVDAPVPDDTTTLPRVPDDADRQPPRDDGRHTAQLPRVPPEER